MSCTSGTCVGAARRGERLPVELFAAEFDRLRELPALRGKIRKFGTRYFGIALARQWTPRERSPWPERENILPTNLPPRGLSRVAISCLRRRFFATLFDELVKDGGCHTLSASTHGVLWDRLQLDQAFVALSDGGKDGTDPWSKVAV